MKLSSERTRFARFGIFKLDTHSKELLKAGRRIKLHGQPMEVLLTLLEKPGEVVPRSELQSRLWPQNTYVDFEHGLNKAISKIRLSIGDSADSPRYLETVPGQGYRFIAPVAWISPEADEPDLLKVEGTSENTRETPMHRVAGRFWTAVIGSVALACLAGAAYYFYRGPLTHVTEVKLTSRGPEFPVEAECISPDGKYIAFADSEGLWLQVVESAETHQLQVPAMSAVTRIAWQPDSTVLILSGTSQSEKISNIWSISIFGGAPRKVRDDAGQAIFSGDGSRIAFTNGDAKELWTMAKTGESAQKIADAGEDDQFGSLVWTSGDTSLIVERIHEDNNTHNSVIEVLSLDKKKITTLFTESDLRSFCITSDGTIIYSRLDSKENSNDTNLWKVHVDPQTGQVVEPPRQLTHWSGLSLSSLSITRDGKRLAVNKGFTHIASYAVRLDASEESPDAITRLTFQDRDDFPGDWDSASRAVFLSSNRGGRWEIFKQDLGRHPSEYVVGSVHDTRYPTLTPDGRSILYQAIPSSLTTWSTPVSLLKVSISGGPPQVLWEGKGFYRVQCARAPANRCVLCQAGPDAKHMVISELDPVHGRLKELGSVATEVSATRLYVAWALSPDGSQIVLTEPAETGTRLRVISLGDFTERNVDVPGWREFEAISWTADGKNFFLLMGSQNGCTILKAHTGGLVQVLRQINHPIQPICTPSPDGKWLAFAELDSISNVSLLTNF